jgi:ribonuclease PH
MTGAGRFVELQGTGENATFDRAEVERLLDLAVSGIQELLAYQRDVLGAVGEQIGREA